MKLLSYRWKLFVTLPHVCCIFWVFLLLLPPADIADRRYGIALCRCLQTYIRLLLSASCTIYMTAT